MRTILAVESLTKRFTPHAPPVVNRVAMTVKEGEIFALLGPSGCGKTTTLRLLAGLEQADAGTVTLDGQCLASANRHLPPEKRGMGLVFQNYALFPHLTVLENVTFGLKHLPAEERSRQGRHVLDLVGLAGYEARRPHELSGGQQQRVAIARTLAPKPRLVMLDEPFSNLDALLRQATRQEIRRVLKQQGTSAVLVTHDQEEALSFADRVAVMRQGQIEQVGTPEDIYYQPRTLFVAQFLGRTNLLLSEATGRTADTPLGRVALNRSASGSVLLSLRPEHLALEAPTASSSEPQAEILERAFKGHDITYRVRHGQSEYLVHTPNRQSYKPGDKVQVRILEPAVVLEGQQAGFRAQNGVTEVPESPA